MLESDQKAGEQAEGWKARRSGGASRVLESNQKAGEQQRAGV